MSISEESAAALTLNLTNPAGAEQLVNAAHFKTMASGTVGGVVKCYFYCQDNATKNMFYVEFVGQVANGSTAVKFKSKDAANIPAISKLFQSVISSLIK